MVKTFQICQNTKPADLRSWVNSIQVALMVKNPPANAGDLRDTGSILVQEDLLEKGTATHSSVLAWKNLRQKCLQATVHKIAELDMIEVTYIIHATQGKMHHN